MTTQEAILT